MKFKTEQWKCQKIKHRLKKLLKKITEHDKHGEEDLNGEKRV